MDLGADAGKSLDPAPWWRRTAASDTGEAEPGATVFVWSILGLMIFLDLIFVVKYTPRVPAYDDYAMAPSYAGERPITLGWLWSQDNEHRVFLPRLIHVASFRLSGGDFRASTLVSLASLAASAAFLIQVARLRRGHLRFADAFLPLIVLGLGQWANLTWAWQVALIVPSAISCTLLGLIVLRPGGPTAGETVAFALGLLVLPLFCGTGLVLAAPLVGWMGIHALAAWRSGGAGGRPQAALILTLGSTTVALIVFYFKGFQKPPYIPERGTPYQILKTTLEFLTIGFGTAVRPYWPSTGPIVVGLVGLGALILLFVVLRQPSERPRAIGLLAFLAACGALALAIGISRAGFGFGSGMAERYVTPAIPILCWAYFTWDIYGPGVTRSLVPLGFFLATVMLFPANCQDGRIAGRWLRDRFLAYERDIEDGKFIYQILKRDSSLINGPDKPSTYLEALHRAGIRPFASLRANPKFREIKLPVVPTAVEHATWDDPTGTLLAEGKESVVAFTLPEPMKLAGIRLDYSFESPQGGGGHFLGAWKPSEDDRYTEDRTLRIGYVPTGQHLSATLWVDDVVKQFRIRPDTLPCKFQIHSITLLIP